MNEITKICSRLDCEFAGIEQPLENFRKYPKRNVYAAECRGCHNRDNRNRRNKDFKKTKREHVPKKGRTKKYSVEDIQQKIFELQGSVVSLDVSTYKNTHTKCKFIDKDYGEWWTAPNWMFSRKTGHPKRGHINGGIIQRTSVEEVKNRIKQLYGDIFSLDESTYVNTTIKCRFIDREFGEWWTKPIDVLGKKGFHSERSKIRKKQTCLERYGVENPSQSPVIAKKQAKSVNTSHTLTHWKTAEELVCVGSYEKRVVEHLNQNQIDFDFQIPFKMPDGRVYFCDLYLEQEDKYVEIKGYFRKDAKEKWDWFCGEYQNSELWNEKRLRELRIL